MRVFTVWVLVTCLMSPANGAIPSVPEPVVRKVGILRLGAGGDSSTGLLEHRFKYWAESDSRLGWEVKSVSQNVSKESWKAETLPLHYRDAQASAIDSLSNFESSLGKKHLKTLMEFRSKIKDMPRYRYLVHRGLLVETAIDRKLGRLQIAQSKLDEARHYHPFGGIDAGWANARKLDVELSSGSSVAGSSVVRGCTVAIPSVGPDDSVRIDGFSVPVQSEYQLVTGRSHFIQVQMNKDWKHASLPCEQDARLEAQLEWRKGHGALTPIEQLSEEFRVDTWLLLEANAKQVRFYAYLPGSKLDEIETVVPMGVTDAAQAFEQGDPFESAELESLIQNYGSRRVAMAGNRLLDTAPVEDEQKWYNSWVLWTLVGTVVGGAVIGVVATSPSKVGTGPSTGVKISFD